MDLSRFDLNLLRALDVLLAEHNVTRAASRLFVTQQAASGALQRLRNHFDDELLTRVGRHFELTPLARSLVLPVREVLLAAQTALDVRPMFDPPTARATCRIAMTDYCLLVLLPRFLRLLSAVAPGVKCMVEPVTEDSFERLEMGDLDFCVTANDWRLYGNRKPGPRIRSENMFQDDFVCVMDDAFTKIGKGLTLKDYQQRQHNAVAFGHGIATIVEKAWTESGLDIDVVVTAPSFSALILMLPGTPIVATAQRRLAISLAPALGLRVAECPLAIPRLQEILMWHERSEPDPKHVFLRSVLQSAAADLDREMPLSHK